MVDRIDNSQDSHAEGELGFPGQGIKPFSLTIVNKQNSRTISNPYPGLRPFDEDDGAIFRGRETQVSELLKSLEHNHFITVTGMSGSGKSSLVKAGLFPSLRGGRFSKAGAKWRIGEMRPGSTAMNRFVKSLSTLLSENSDASYQSEKIEDDLYKGGIRRVLQNSFVDPGTNFLLLIDQFEEIFRFRERISREEKFFVEKVVETFNDPIENFYVVLTMRSDYIGDCTYFRGLPNAVNKSIYLVPSLTETELEQVIREPAQMFGGQVDQELVNVLINHMGIEHDNLPLLQHALMWMWNLAIAEIPDNLSPPRIGNSLIDPSRKNGAHLTIASYEQDKVKDIFAALSSHGDAVFDELTDDQKRIAKLMFQRLTERDDGKRDIRHPTNCRDIRIISGCNIESLATVVSHFGDKTCSFIKLPMAIEDGSETINDDTELDIMHEALIRQWQMLKTEWVEEEVRNRDRYISLCESYLKHSRQPADIWLSGNQIRRGNRLLRFLRELDLSTSTQEVDSSVKSSEKWTERYPLTDNSDPPIEKIVQYLKKSEKKYISTRIRQKYGIFGAITATSLAVFLLVYVAHQNGQKYIALQGTVHENLIANANKIDAAKNRSKESAMRDTEDYWRSIALNDNRNEIHTSIHTLSLLNKNLSNLQDTKREHVKATEEYKGIFYEKVSQIKDMNFGSKIASQTGGENFEFNLVEALSHMNKTMSAYEIEMKKRINAALMHLNNSIASLPRPLSQKLPVSNKIRSIHFSSNDQVFLIVLENNNITVLDRKSFEKVELKPEKPLTGKDLESSQSEVKTIRVSEDNRIISTYYEVRYKPVEGQPHKETEYYLTTWKVSDENKGVWHVASQYKVDNLFSGTHPLIAQNVDENQLWLVYGDGRSASYRLDSSKPFEAPIQNQHYWNKNRFMAAADLPTNDFTSRIEVLETLKSGELVAIWVLKTSGISKLVLSVLVPDNGRLIVKKKETRNLSLVQIDGSKPFELRVDGNGYVYATQLHKVQRWQLVKSSADFVTSNEPTPQIVVPMEEGRLRIVRIPSAKSKLWSSPSISSSNNFQNGQIVKDFGESPTAPLEGKFVSQMLLSEKGTYSSYDGRRALTVEGDKLETQDISNPNSSSNESQKEPSHVRIWATDVGSQLSFLGDVGMIKAIGVIKDGTIAFIARRVTNSDKQYVVDLVRLDLSESKKYEELSKSHIVYDVSENQFVSDKLPGRIIPAVILLDSNLQLSHVSAQNKAANNRPKILASQIKISRWLAIPGTQFFIGRNANNQIHIFAGNECALAKEAYERVRGHPNFGDMRNREFDFANPSMSICKH